MWLSKSKESSGSKDKIFEKIKTGDERVFELFFKQYFLTLFRISLKYVKDKQAAEDLTQDLFLFIWEKKRTLDINNDLMAYLRTAIKNRSLNYLQKKITQSVSLTESHDNTYWRGVTEETILGDDTLRLVHKAIEQLPQKCGVIFSMSRFSGLTYQEIADVLGISTRTVEVQMGIALKRMTEFFKDY